LRVVAHDLDEAISEAAFQLECNEVLVIFDELAVCSQLP
jgi:hypothetical protein